MRITHLEASNWRNFKNINFDIAERLFIVGPNAAGKSNLLDVFRFMSDIASRGGGLATALERRGGLKKVRSLYARNNARGRLILDIQLQDGGGSWRYRLEVKGEQGGKNRPIVDRELVERNGEVLLNRPDEHDKADPELLTQTHLEQIAANHDFRPIAEYFARVQYFHLVPQIIRDPARANVGGDDPFGSDFIAQMNATSTRTRDAGCGACRRLCAQPSPVSSRWQSRLTPLAHPTWSPATRTGDRHQPNRLRQTSPTGRSA